MASSSSVSSSDGADSFFVCGIDSMTEELESTRDSTTTAFQKGDQGDMSDYSTFPGSSAASSSCLMDEHVELVTDIRGFLVPQIVSGKAASPLLLSPPSSTGKLPPKVDLMDVIITVYGATGILCHAKEKKGRTSLRRKNLDHQEKSQLFNPKAARSEDAQDEAPPSLPRELPTTAVVSFTRQAVGSASSMETFLPSMPLQQQGLSPTIGSRCMQYRASWGAGQEEVLAPDSDQKGAAEAPPAHASTFQMRRVFHRQSYRPGTRIGEVSTHVHQTTELCVFVAKGRELLPVGVAVFILTGQEDSEVILNVPITEPKRGSPSYKKHFAQLQRRRRKGRTSKRPSFADKPRQKFCVDDNATLRIGVRVIPAQTVEGATKLTEPRRSIAIGHDVEDLDEEDRPMVFDGSVFANEPFDEDKFLQGWFDSSVADKAKNSYEDNSVASSEASQAASLTATDTPSRSTAGNTVESYSTGVTVKHANLGTTNRSPGRSNKESALRRLPPVDESSVVTPPPINRRSLFDDPPLWLDSFQSDSDTDSEDEILLDDDSLLHLDDPPADDSYPEDVSEESSIAVVHSSPSWVRTIQSPSVVMKTRNSILRNNTSTDTSTCTENSSVVTENSPAAAASNNKSRPLSWFPYDATCGQCTPHA